MMDLSALNYAGKTLRGIGLGQTVEGFRRAAGRPYEPWVHPACASRAQSVRDGQTGDLLQLYALLHLGQPLEKERLSPSLSEYICTLASAGLTTTQDEAIEASPWDLTSLSGIIVAANRRYGHDTTDVHIGEDSFRFTEALLTSSLTGRVLDIGSGSGISAVATARTAEHVTTIDINPAAGEATRTTAALNHVENVTFLLNDFRESDEWDRHDTVIANLPGVPVPSELRYPAAGDGGPDGLCLIRSVLEQAVESFVRQGTGRLIMRFQSSGGPDGPRLVEELRHMLRGFPAYVAVTTDACIPMHVRHVATAVNASDLNSTMPIVALIKLLQDKTSVSNDDYYYAGTLDLQVGADQHTLQLPLHLSTDFENRYTSVQVGPWDSRKWEIALQYARALPRMPEEFWDLGAEEVIHSTLERQLLAANALRDGESIAEVAASVMHASAESDLRVHCAAALSVAVLAGALVDLDLLRVAQR